MPRRPLLRVALRVHGRDARRCAQRQRLTAFVFWELTGFTSFLLIGVEHERPAARAAAPQALRVTGAGGLGLLLGAWVLLVDAAGTTSLAAMVTDRASIVTTPFHAAMAILVLLAAFTKSAQVPFHFWLPHAMEAPTPVRAHLHSATMVKAGVYLIARMTRVLGSTALWTTALTVAGAAAMVVGAWRAVQDTDVKRILAYSSLSALGHRGPRWFEAHQRAEDLRREPPERDHLERERQRAREDGHAHAERQDGPSRATRPRQRSEPSRASALRRTDNANSVTLLTFCRHEVYMAAWDAGLGARTFHNEITGTSGRETLRVHVLG